MPFRCLCALAILITAPVCGRAQEAYQPEIAPASAEAGLAIHRFQLPAGWQAELVAAEPQLANPVAFCFDEQGRIYVAETFRQSKGVEDNRGHMSWLVDDLAAQTVADRVKYFRKHLGDKVNNYTKEHDRIRVLIDDNGDGKMDADRVFADGFHDIATGTGAGVLAWNGDLFYTCIPDLWRLRDANGDHVADERTSLHTGYGVRVAFRGHDLHGLTVGPDGRLYFSIGDRGFNIKSSNPFLPPLTLPDQGAVLRCELDGSNLEVFAVGLRNPQELAFDDWGNLFTGDNNCDSGDKARWVYVMEGSDSGWRMYYQYLKDRGPWNREKLWHTAHEGQAAYIIPPVAHLADGPSGLTYDSGTLPAELRGKFLMADFRGTAGNSGIRSFGVKPNGAGFELVDSQQLLWSILSTDVEIGYDGAVYVSDWVDGWEGLGKGRIYRFLPPDWKTDSAAQQVAQLIREGFAKRDKAELRKLLAHADRRIRERAQMELASRTARDELWDAAKNGASLQERLHGLWGLWQVYRRLPPRQHRLNELLTDTEPEIRAQVARVLSEIPGPRHDLTFLLKDNHPRVRSFAAIALGRMHATQAVDALIAAVAENADADPYLRHALVQGLVTAATEEQLTALNSHPLLAVRRAVVVALRRRASAQLAVFLRDVDPAIALEAGRAIHDVQGIDAVPALAALAGRPGLEPELLRRVLNANYRLGAVECATAVARIAADEDTPETLRIEALQELHDWNVPHVLDRVTNEYRPLAERTIDVAAVVRPMLGDLFSGRAKVRDAAAKLAAKHQISDVEPYLIGTLENTDRDESERASALTALATLKSEQLESLLTAALKDRASAVRSTARQVYAETFPNERAVPVLQDGLRTGDPREQQAAIGALVKLKRSEADRVLEDELQRLARGEARPEIQLDLLDAARLRNTASMKSAVEQFDKLRKPDDHLRDYRETLLGGDVDQGREIFFGRGDVSCRRCHKIGGDGGDVGPDLSKIGVDKNREYLLEALVDPNKQIAKGFDTIVLQTDDGKVHAGVVKQDDADRITLQTVDRGLVVVEKSTIEDRAVGKSGMPEDLVKKLTKADVRNLVEFLASCDGKDAAAHGR